MKTTIQALRFFAVMTILTGLLYPLGMTGVSQILFSHQANGSLIKDSSGKVIGSELIAQKFQAEKYFRSRPSAIDYNPMPSGGSNWGPISQDLLKQVNDRRAQGLTDEMLFASGSGLDPHISVEAARHQMVRVAKARGLNETTVQELVNSHIENRQFGFLGEKRINVLNLNLALDKTH